MENKWLSRTQMYQVVGIIFLYNIFLIISKMILEHSFGK